MLLRKTSLTFWGLPWRLSLLDHEEKLGYGRAIMFFSCKVRPSERLPVEIKHLVFMEEVWRYTAPKPDYLADEYKCHRFYSNDERASPHLLRDPTLRTT